MATTTFDALKAALDRTNVGYETSLGKSTVVSTDYCVLMDTNNQVKLGLVTDVVGDPDHNLAGATTLTGAVTMVGALTHDVDLGTTWGAGLIGTGVAPKAYRRTENGVIITTYKIDLTGLTAKGTDDDCIGLKVGAADSYFDQYTIATHGVLFKTEMICVETLAGAATVEVDLSAAAAAKEYDEAVGDKFLDSGITAAGQSAVDLVNTPTADHYLHIVESDDVGDDSVFTAGQLIIILYGHPVLT